MLKSFVAGMLALLAATFGGHSINYAAPYVAEPSAHARSAQVSAAALAAAPPAPASTAPATASVYFTPDGRPQASLPSRTVLEQQIASPLVRYATLADLASSTAKLDAKLQSEFAVLSVPANVLTVPAWAPSQAINHLSNITVSGVSGLAASDIPSLSYLPLSGGIVSGLSQFTSASTSLFSVSGPAYFGSTANSIFGADGSLTLGNTSACGGGCVAALAGVDVQNNPLVLTVPNLAAIKAINISALATTNEVILRSGYSTPGDGGAAAYTITSGNCAAADNGYEIQPNTGAYCFVAIVPADGLPIKVWGLKGDGLTNDSSALSTALAAGVPLWCNPGTYDIKTSAAMPTGTVIRAAPNSCTLLTDAANVGAGGATLLRGVNASHILVSNVIFDGNLTNNSFVGTRLVYINGGDDVVFDNDWFQNSAQVGIAFSGGTNPIKNSGVRNSHFYNVGMYWSTSGSGLSTDAKSAISFANGTPANNYGNFASDNSFSLIGGDVTDINAQSHFLWANNRLNLSQSSWRPTVSGGTYGVGGVYVLNGSYGITITGNTLDGATSQNIAIGDSLTAIKNITVDGNTLSNPGGSNIAIAADVSGFSVSGNTLSDSYQSTGYAVPNVINQGSITFLCGQSPCTGTVQNGVVGPNTITDDQGTPTMLYGIWSESGVTLTNVQISPSNAITNATVASYGGGLTGPTPISILGGGTSTSTWQTNSIPYFNGTYFTENNASFNFNGTTLTAKYASTTAFSASGNSYFNGSLSINSTTGSLAFDGLPILYASSSLSNLSFGFSAGAATTTTGTGNLSIGLSALAGLTNGLDNVAIGNAAGQSMSNAGNSVFVGYNAAKNHTGGTTVAIGALTLNGSGGGASDTALGYEAGSNDTSGARNIFLGAYVASTTATGSNNIALGYDIALPSANGSNQLDIGNLIYGTGINGEGTTVSTGNIGIGTTSPSTALQVNGVITPNADNSSSLGNATYRWSSVFAANGTIQTSDARLKSNVADLNYGLPDLLKLRPVSFTWTAQPQQGTQLGFIAQEVQTVFPETVNVGDDANHTLGLTYTEFIPVIVRSIQDIAHITGAFRDALVAWMGDAGNGIQDLFANNVYAGHELCVDKSDGTPVCITGDQLAAVLAGQTGSAPSGEGSAGGSSGDKATSSPDSPPVIQINGDNPAAISVGDTYQDLGATITGPASDLNLGIHTFVGDTPIEYAAIDTSTTTTYHIYYVAADAAGLTSTSTRTVIVQAATSTVQ